MVHDYNPKTLSGFLIKSTCICVVLTFLRQKKQGPIVFLVFVSKITPMLRNIISLLSRRSFSGILNLKDAKMQAIRWAVESLVAHRLDRVVLGIEDSVLVDIFERPKAWPSYKVT